MSHQDNENWDVCWSYLSSAGCRNSQCTWRHGNSFGRPYQNYGKKLIANANLSRGLSREMPIAPFYPWRQHDDVGVEDEHGLVHYTDIGYNYDLQKSSLLSNFADSSGSEHSPHMVGSINVSSLGEDCIYTPESTSLKILDAGSISESDMVRNTIVKVSGERSNTRKSKISAFSKGALQEFLTSTAQLKVKGSHRGANASMALKNTSGQKAKTQKNKISAFSEGALREFLTPRRQFQEQRYPLEQIKVPFLYMYE